MTKRFLGVCIAVAVLVLVSTLTPSLNAIAQTEPAGGPEPISIALPLANTTADGVSCKQTDALSDPMARAYARLLSERFNTAVTLCFTETIAQATELARSGQVNMAWADQDSFATVAETWRSMLALRSMNGLGRVPYVLFTKADSGNTLSLNEIDPNRIGFFSSKPHALNIELAQNTLADYGIIVEAVSAEASKSSLDDLMQAVETGALQAGVLEANSWGRYCAVLDADSTFCDAFEVLMFDRPRATEAVIIPTSTSTERHHRLVGVHIALHFEHPEIFEWLSPGDGPEFAPTEARALHPKSADAAVVF